MSRARHGTETRRFHVEFPQHPALRSSTALDVSAAGLLLEHAGGLCAGDPLEILLRFPALREEVRCHARVAWVDCDLAGIFWVFYDDDEPITLDLYLRHDRLLAA